MSQTLRERSKPHHLRPPEPAVEYEKSLRQAGGDPRVAEWIEHCKKAVADFSYFAEFMCGVRVHPGQLSVVNNMYASDYGVLAAANGWGKTFLYALIALWSSFGKVWAPRGWGNYRVAVLGPQMQQSLITHSEIELLRKQKHEAQEWCEHPAPCQDSLTCPERTRHQFRLSPWLIPFKTPATHLAYRWKHNGSLIHFESGEKKAENVEGWRLNVIIYDEARLELHLKFIMDQVFLARATRTPNQKILLGSTPLSDSYDLLEYYRRGESGKKDWWSHLGSIRENIFLSPAQVQKVRDSLDARIVEQVLEGKWVEPPDAYFIREKVDVCFAEGPDVPPDIGGFTGKYVPGFQYIGGLDVAASVHGDESVVTIWDITMLNTEGRAAVVVEHVFARGTPLTEVVQYCDVLILEFAAIIGFDASGPLGVELEHQVSGDPASYIPIKFTGGNQEALSQVKLQAFANFAHFINNEMISFPYLPDTRKQIVSYNVKQHGYLKKDRLMAQVYAAWVAKDYVSPSGEGLHMSERTSYQGQGVKFGPSVPRGLENKTLLQRQLIRMADERELQRMIEEQQS